MFIVDPAELEFKVAVVMMKVKTQTSLSDSLTNHSLQYDFYSSLQAASLGN